MYVYICLYISLSPSLSRNIYICSRHVSHQIDHSYMCVLHQIDTTTRHVGNWSKSVFLSVRRTVVSKVLVLSHNNNMSPVRSS